MSTQRGARWALAVFFATWIPLSVWRGIVLGRSLRIGEVGRRDWRPLGDAIINLAAVMLAPAALVALAFFVLWMWREERRDARRARESR